MRLLAIVALIAAASGCEEETPAPTTTDPDSIMRAIAYGTDEDVDEAIRLATPGFAQESQGRVLPGLFFFIDLREVDRLEVGLAAIPRLIDRMDTLLRVNCAYILMTIQPDCPLPDKEIWQVWWDYKRPQYEQRIAELRERSEDESTL